MAATHTPDVESAQRRVADGIAQVGDERAPLSPITSTVSPRRSPR